MTSKLIESSSQVDWPISHIPQKLRHSRKSQTFNPEDDCQVNTLIEGTLKDDNSWRKHLTHQCWCHSCTCGKHLCKLHPMKLAGKLPPSDYKINYRRHVKTVQSPTKYPDESSHLKSVILSSTYNADFTQKDSNYKDLRNKIKQNLEVGGPMFAGTTYKQEYYPKVCTNIGQLPLPDSNIFAMNVPLNAKSSYNDNYKKHAALLTESFKPSTKFTKSTSLDYVKGTTYGATYKLPSLEAYKNLKASPQRRVHTETDNLKKKSEYQASFLSNSLKMCPVIAEMKKTMAEMSK